MKHPRQKPLRKWMKKYRKDQYKKAGYFPSLD
jgi:hypothetical protein